MCLTKFCRRSFDNKARDDWREEFKGGENLLPRNYRDQVKIKEQPKVDRSLAKSASHQQMYQYPNPQPVCISLVE